MKRGSKRRRVNKQAEIDFSRRINQEQFGHLVNLAQQTVSKLLDYNVLSPDGTAREWVQQYTRFKMGEIFARQGWAGLALIFEPRAKPPRN